MGVLEDVLWPAGGGLDEKHLYGPEDASLEDCREAEILLEADAKVSTRVLGADHPHTQRYAHLLRNTRHRRDQALNRARRAAAAT